MSFDILYPQLAQVRQILQEMPDANRDKEAMWDKAVADAKKGQQGIAQPSLVPGGREKNDFTNLYNTELSKEDEKAFEKWASDPRENGLGRDARGDIYNYDIKGFWKKYVKDQGENAAKPNEEGHLPDEFKKPNHPTFSTQSVYNGRDGHFGGMWIDMGENYADSKGRYKFIYNPLQLSAVDPTILADYFDKYEKGRQNLINGSNFFGNPGGD